MNRFTWIARLVMPSVVEGIGIGLEELKETTPEHFDKVLDWSKDNIFQELADIYTDRNEDNKEQLKNWYETKRAGFLYVSLVAVIEEGKLLAAERMDVESDGYFIIVNQLNEMQKTLGFLQSKVGDKKEVEEEFVKFVNNRLDKLRETARQRD